MKNIFIFDLDGTIALNHHRQHFVDGENQNLDAFFKACVDDEPNWPVIYTLLHLRKTSEIWIWSGRSEDVRQETLDWLMNHGVIDNRQYRFWHKNPNRFLMRPSGDFTADDVLKKKWLDSLNHIERRNLIGVFDDRNKVVKMWRDNGVACFQVAVGDF